MTQRTSLAAFRRSIPAFALALVLFACSEDKSNDLEPVEGNSLLLNFTSDYVTGELRWMHPNSTRLSEGALLFSQDSKISTGGGNIFVLENNPGNLSCILPQNITDVKQKSLEANYPYEVAVISNKGYIALNDADYVQVFDVSTCSPSNKINLPISDASASTIKASGDTLLVTLQRLEWQGEYLVATKPGLLVRIKASTETIIDTIQLHFYNPSSSVLNNGTLIVASSTWGAGNDGIEIVDLKEGTSNILTNVGTSSIALDEENQILYASVYITWGNSPVKPVNIATKTIGDLLPDIFASEDLVFDEIGKKLFVGDRDFSNPGLKVYDPVTKTTATIGNQDPLLPPYSLAIVNF